VVSFSSAYSCQRLSCLPKLTAVRHHGHKRIFIRCCAVEPNRRLFSHKNNNNMKRTRPVLCSDSNVVRCLDTLLTVSNALRSQTASDTIVLNSRLVSWASLSWALYLIFQPKTPRDSVGRPTIRYHTSRLQLDSLYVRSKVKVRRTSDHRDTQLTRNDWNFAIGYFHCVQEPSRKHHL